MAAFSSRTTPIALLLLTSALMTFSLISLLARSGRQVGISLSRPSVNGRMAVRNPSVFRSFARAPVYSTSSSAKKVMVCIADGSEEIETSGIFDTLIRGGVDVTLAKVGGDKSDLVCKMSRGMKFVADTHFDEVSPSEKFDMVVLPGGLPGAQAFAGSDNLVEKLKQRKQSGEWYAAICASPAVVLAPNDLLPNKATCFPALQEKIAPHLRDGASTERVVIDADRKVITSQGPGTTLEFGVELLALLQGEDKADEVANGLLIKRATAPSPA